MNRLLFSVLALLALTNMALAIVCTKNSCDGVDCVPLSEENCNYTIVANGSWCSCCDACIHMLKDGEECPTMHIMGGPPPSTRCADGSVCCSETDKAGDVTATCRSKNVPCKAGQALSNISLLIVCTENYCDAVHCEPLSEENCTYTIVANGSMCGCCDACIHMLKDGEECPTMHIMGGPPPSTRCADGSVCCSETDKAGNVTATCRSGNVACTAGHLECSLSTAKMAIGIFLFHLVLFMIKKM